MQHIQFLSSEKVLKKVKKSMSEQHKESLYGKRKQPYNRLPAIDNLQVNAFYFSFFFLLWS